MRPPEPVPNPEVHSPASALRQAQAEAAVDERSVTDVSAQLLDKFLALAPAERLRHIEDPDLVSADRVTLRSSLEASLVPERRRIRLPRLWRRGQFARRLRSCLIRAVLSPLMIGLIVVGGPWLAVSWQNTRPLATLTDKGLFAFRLPNGREEYLKLSKGSTVTVFDATAADPVIGLWYPRLGYGTASVPRAALRFVR